MKVVVITGTEVKGCTYHLKEVFIEALGPTRDVTEFTLPKDMPHFCTGCKACFFHSEERCPHASSVMPIWNAVLEAELIVFAAPVYAYRAPGQVKALLDHFACHWTVHRPRPEMFTKHAAILTQSIGAPNRPTQNDMAASLSWMGVSHIRRLGFGLMEGVVWEQLSEKRREKMIRKTEKFARSFVSLKPAGRSLKVRILFAIARMMHKATLKNEERPGADNQYWIDQGWLKPKAPGAAHNSGGER